MRSSKSTDSNVPKGGESSSNEEFTGQSGRITERKEVTWGKALDKQKYGEKAVK